MSLVGSSKRCTKCGTSKPLGAFYSHPRTKDGLQSNCKECMKGPAQGRRTIQKRTGETPKYCRRCDTYKPSAAFDHDPYTTDQLKSTCRECVTYPERTPMPVHLLPSSATFLDYFLRLVPCDGCSVRSKDGATIYPQTRERAWYEESSLEDLRAELVKRSFLCESCMAKPHLHDTMHARRRIRRFRATTIAKTIDEAFYFAFAEF